MKLYALLAVLVAAFLHLTVAEETCPIENCVAPQHCDAPLVGGICGDSGNVCCALVKREFRTHCRHHGGLCMKSCNVNLQRDVVDCPVGEACCVLV